MYYDMNQRDGSTSIIIKGDNMPVFMKAAFLPVLDDEDEEEEESVESGVGA